MKRFTNQLQQLLEAKSWLLLLPFLLLAAGLAFANAPLYTLWFDEVYTNFFSGTLSYYPLSVLGSILLVAKTDVWPPLFYLTFRLWHSFTGDSVFAQSLLPLFYGLIAVACMYRLGNLLFAKPGGFFAASLLATSAFFAYYLHEIRE